MNHEQALMDARARGYREALNDAHDAIGLAVPTVTRAILRDLRDRGAPRRFDGGLAMSDHLPECPWPDEPCGHEPMHDRQPLFCVACLSECICDRLRACEQRLWQQPLLAVSRRGGWNDALIAASAVLKDHRPVPVIECACGWGKDCPECGSESNRIVGYACDVCCNSSGDHAYCDDMHYDDDTPLHHQDGLWTGPHCPVIASIDALKEKP